MRSSNSRWPPATFTTGVELAVDGGSAQGLGV